MVTDDLTTNQRRDLADSERAIRRLWVRETIADASREAIAAAANAPAGVIAERLSIDLALAVRLRAEVRRTLRDCLIFEEAKHGKQRYAE